jgi:glutamate synthase domain-containing protein 3
MGEMRLGATFSGDIFGDAFIDIGNAYQFTAGKFGQDFGMMLTKMPCSHNGNANRLVPI